MSLVSHISSQSHLDRLLSSNSIVIVDFWADWCGPCKAIAPVFEQQAELHSKQGRLAFAKVDVDSQQAVSKKYGVTAMPTFLVLQKDAVVKSIRGANPAALRSAISEAAALAAKGGSQGFSSQGHVLGSAPKAGTTTNRRTTSQAPFTDAGFIADITRFFMLYVTTLLSLDPVASAQSSPYRKNTA